MEFINFNNWITLAVIGGVAITSASVLEKHGASIKHKLSNKRQVKLGAYE